MQLSEVVLPKGVLVNNLKFIYRTPSLFCLLSLSLFFSVYFQDLYPKEESDRF